MNTPTAHVTIANRAAAYLRFLTRTLPRSFAATVKACIRDWPYVACFLSGMGLLNILAFGAIAPACALGRLFLGQGRLPCLGPCCVGWTAYSVMNFVMSSPGAALPAPNQEKDPGPTAADRVEPYPSANDGRAS
jgi:hypothetical protein